MIIDVHHHCLPRFLIEAFEAAGRRPSLAGFPKWSPEMSIALMDRFGIDRAILSVAVPGVHLGDDHHAETLARRFNDYCAELKAITPRFDAFATLPLPDVDGSLRALEQAQDELSLAGIGLFASYGDLFLGDPVFEPVMAELDRRAMTVFVHPMGHPTSHALNTAAPLWMLEYPFDTTRAALNLILSGTLDRFPQIRFILAHAGGVLPFLKPRLSAISEIDKRFPASTAERVASYIASFYYETAQASGPASFAALQEATGPEHILFGSDFPYCSGDAIAGMVANLPLLRGGTDGLRKAGSALFSTQEPEVSA